MNVEDVCSLLGHFEKSSFSEIDFQMGEIKLSVKRNAGNVLQETKYWKMPENKTSDSKILENSNKVEVRAPFVGTFYRSASPKDRPFVVTGQKVHKGQVIGIIEAMKLMNEITAPKDGVVEAILIKDGEMVEYDKTIFILDQTDCRQE